MQHYLYLIFNNEYWAIMYKTVTNISKNKSTYFGNLFAHDSPPVLYILLIKTGRIRNGFLTRRQPYSWKVKVEEEFLIL